MKKILLSAAVCLLFLGEAYAQGCVAIRSNGMSCSMEHPAEEASASGWQLNVSHRYFKSFRHYKGDEEQKERLIENTEVVNWQHSMDISLLRNFNNKWSLAVGIPLLANKRSSLYEHGRKERHNSNSAGIGDARIVGYKWLLDPQKATKGNLQLGLGVKLPTGNYNYKDNFYNVGPDGGEEERPVDQSIQLGDGGVGAITELNGYYVVGNNVSVYGNVYYLFNPRGENGTRTYRETLSPLRANEAIMSVADQYMVRFGASHSFSGKLKGMVASLGARMEGVPVEDAFGSSKGFRRPGYVQSIEPGVSYQVSKVSFFASVPVAFKRDRLQSVTDKEVSAQTGTYIHGDAAFSDYAINIGASLKL